MLNSVICVSFCNLISLIFWYLCIEHTSPVLSYQLLFRIPYTNKYIKTFFLKNIFYSWWTFSLFSTFSVTNDTCMIILIHTSCEHMWASSDMYGGVELPNYWVSPSSTSLDGWKIASKCLYQFAYPLEVYKGFCFCCILTNICYCQAFNFCLFDKYEIFSYTVLIYIFMKMLIFP